MGFDVSHCTFHSLVDIVSGGLEPVLKSKLISESFHFTGKYPQNQLISPLK